MVASPDEPRTGTPPAPTEHLVLVPVLSIITLCLLFILWRRAAAMKGAFAYRLKNRTLRGPGTIRLGDEERPPIEDGDLTDDDELAFPTPKPHPIPPKPPVTLTFTPPTPAADPAAIFELGDAEEGDAVELPARIGEEEVLGAKEDGGEVELLAKKGGGQTKGGRGSGGRS